MLKNLEISELRTTKKHSEQKGRDWEQLTIILKANKNENTKKEPKRGIEDTRSIWYGNWLYEWGYFAVLGGYKRT